MGRAIDMKLLFIFCKDKVLAVCAFNRQQLKVLLFFIFTANFLLLSVILTNSSSDLDYLISNFAWTRLKAYKDLSKVELQ